MASIKGESQKSIMQINKWMGLNESPDGDTALEIGEAAYMRNFKVTREGHLQIRPGYGAVCAFPGAAGSRVNGLWLGYVQGRRELLAACKGTLYRVTPGSWTVTAVGSIGGLYNGRISFFGFAKKVYIITSSGYYCYDGTTVKQVEGYIPLIAVAAPPSGGGTTLEAENKLTGKKRQRFSPDGTSTAFQLAETGIDEVLAVEGTLVTYTVDAAAGKVTFAAAPAVGTDSLTITWRKGTGDRDKVTAMRYAEMFGGGEGRVLLYGDGSNECIYSGLDQYGQPTAEYFPALNVAAIGTENTPITAMIRHYDRVLAYKPDGAWAMEFTTLTLTGGAVTTGFKIESINREVGCEAPGQAQLVNNNPRTLFGAAVYEWPLSNYAVRDERNAKRLSDKVTATLAGFDLSKVTTFDDNEDQEYYIVHGDQALVHNYGSGAWYYYDDVPMTCMVKVDGVLYFGTPDGRLMEFSRKYRNDDLRPIDARWESGSMDFGKDWMRKYSTLVWVGIKPETQGLVYLTAESNRNSEYPDKVIAAGLANFDHADFNHWSFGTNRKPKVVRAKLKLKKFTYYKLILHSRSASATATVVGVDIQVRYTGNVK